MALPYRYERSLNNTRGLLFNAELEVSLNLADGIPLIFSANGKLTPVTAQTDRPLYVLNGVAQTSAQGSLVNITATPSPILNQIGNGYDATSGPFGNPSVKQLGGFADVLPAMNGFGIWRTQFTPVFKNVVSAATGSPTSISITNNTGGTIAAGRYNGGTLYCASLNQQVQITNQAVATNGAQMVLTIASPLGQNGAPINADGLTFSATPLGKGMSGYKFSSIVSVAADGYVPSQLGVGSADASGGFLQIFEVDIQQGFLGVIFN